MPTQAFSQYIRNWLTSHPLISIAALEKECRIPETTLMRTDRDIPAKHWYSLCWHLSHYGLTIGEWRLYQDPMAIIRHRYIDTPIMDEEFLYHPTETRALDDVDDFKMFLESYFQDPILPIKKRLKSD